MTTEYESSEPTEDPRPTPNVKPKTAALEQHIADSGYGEKYERYFSETMEY